MRVNVKLIFASLAIFLLNFTAGLFLSSEFDELFSLRGPILLKEDMYSFLINNIQVVLQAILGSVSFGATSFVNLSLNGISLGILIKNVIQNGAPITDILLLILPHGIFEIPAIIIAGAAGFKIPYEVTRYLAGRKEQILTRQDIKDYLTLSLISIILIIIAAWIEANITMRIAESMTGKGI